MGIDSLTISSKDLWYVSKIPFNNPVKVEYKSMSDSEKDDLFNSLDINEFLKIELNASDVCPDCDEYWISLENDTLYHKIHFDHTDSTKLSSIKSFINKLDVLKAKFD